MLVDCGVHAHGAARPLAESVKNIISDLAKDCGGTPHLDVVVATHHHRDHIRGFADDRWADVEVDEVWVPFVENDDDADAKGLREAHTRTAQKLAGLIDDRKQRLAANQTEAKQSSIWRRRWREFTWEREGHRPPAGSQRHDLRQARARSAVPSRQGPVEEHDQSAPVRGGGAHLRPSSRPGDSEEDGPAEDGRMADAEPGRRRRRSRPDDGRPPPTAKKPEDDKDIWPLFNRTYVIADHDAGARPSAEGEVQPQADHAVQRLGAAGGRVSVLEQSVNNTSLFFVLEVGGLRLLFPGDAQYGAWEHVRNNPEAMNLIRDADFYKMGHHGSHNATPMRSSTNSGSSRETPWFRGVSSSSGRTPFPEKLIDALTAKHHRVIKPTEVLAGDDSHSELVTNEWWSQLTFTLDG